MVAGDPRHYRHVHGGVHGGGHGRRWLVGGRSRCTVTRRIRRRISRLGGISIELGSSSIGLADTSSRLSSISIGLVSDFSTKARRVSVSGRRPAGRAWGRPGVTFVVSDLILGGKLRLAGIVCRCGRHDRVGVPGRAIAPTPRPGGPVRALFPGWRSGFRGRHRLGRHRLGGQVRASRGCRPLRPS